jgi:hypothetical protein
VVPIFPPNCCEEIISYPLVPSADVNSNKNVNSNNFDFQPKSRETTRNRECSKILIPRFLVVSRDFDCFVGVYVFVGVYGRLGSSQSWGQNSSWFSPIFTVKSARFHGQLFPCPERVNTILLLYSKIGRLYAVHISSHNTITS